MLKHLIPNSQFQFLDFLPKLLFVQKSYNSYKYRKFILISRITQLKMPNNLKYFPKFIVIYFFTCYFRIILSIIYIPANNNLEFKKL
jgi:hypothetical protein